MTSTDQQRVTWREILLLLAILIIAAVLRCYRVADESAWYDEVASLQFADAPTLAQFLKEERPDDPMAVPLYFSVEYLVWHLFPRSIVAVRFLSIIVNLSTLIVLYSLGRRLFGRTAATVATACAAVAMQQVYYAQEIRMYSLFLFSAALSMWAMERLLRGKGGAWWLVYGVANAMLIWTHLHGLWLVAMQAVIFLVAWRKDIRRLLVCGLINAVIVAPAALWVATVDETQVKANLGWIPPLNMDAIRRLFEFIAHNNEAAPVPPLAPLRWDEALGLPTISVGLLIVVWLFTVAAASLYAWRRRNNPDAAPVAVMLAWLLIPSAILIGLTLVWKPMYLPRYVLHSSFALHLLMGAGIAAIGNTKWRTMTACILIGLYAYPVLSFPFPRRANMRDVMAVVCEQPPKQGTRVLIYPDTNKLAATFYCTCARDAVEPVHDWPELTDRALQAAQEGHACWLVVGAINMKETPPDLEPLLRQRNLDFEYQHMLGMFPLRLYHVLPLE